ncbi:asparagine synthetase B [Pontibacter chitinilyticus]|uniref:asparagine synthetase B n=1 Tax=Pontibacter chitinilyticus TaxID=2674989 RepID=UPI00321B77BC
MFFRTTTLLLCLLLLTFKSIASTLFIPMDETQKDHLKSYGIAYWALTRNVPVDWLLNYRGGSFAFQHAPQLENELIVRGITYSVISDAQYNSILQQVAAPDANMDVVKLEKAPKIAVYSPKTKMPWDDAVTLVLTYAEIPYDVLYDEEIVKGDLPKYDWLHLHHEDFTGQYGKFYASYRNYPWYQEQQAEAEALASKLGFQKVSQLKLAVVNKIKDFCAGGGFLFAMCSATDTYDIALAADGVDIVESMFDGDPADPQAQQKLDYSKTFAFKDFRISQNPLEYEYSNIDMQPQERPVTEENDYFQLFTFSAKYDPIPTMLTQNHEKTIKGFMGQTTAFRKGLVKPEVIVMGENKELGEIRYMHGTYARGTWTFYGGHDPEDYQHLVGEEPTDLALHPNSPGYRLILNNILFPAAKKKKQKT